LNDVRGQAGLDIPDEAVDLAVRRGRGSARDALSVLDQVVASDAVDDDLPELDLVVEALAERAVHPALAAVAQLVASGHSPQELAGDLIDHLRQGFLTLVAPELVAVTGTERDALRGRAERVGLATLVRAMEVLGRAQVDMRDAPDPRVSLEVALVRLAHPAADNSPDALLARIEHLEAAGRIATAPPSTGSAPVPPPPPVAPGPSAAPAPPDTDPGGPPSSAPSAPAGSRPTIGALRRQSPAPGPEHVDPGPATPPARSDPPTGSPPRSAAADGSGPPADLGTSFPTRDQLVQAWGDHIIGGLRPKAKALFQAGRFVGVDGDRAVFGLPNEIHRTRCEEVLGEIESALAAHFGRPVGVTLVVDPGTDGGSGATPSPGHDPAPPPSAGTPATANDPGAARPDDEVEDLAAFDESELGEVSTVDHSAETRVLQAFPGAEEVG
jgi:DNA polymerase-3 subunit gamma/tau